MKELFERVVKFDVLKHYKRCSIWWFNCIEVIDDAIRDDMVAVWLLEIHVYLCRHYTCYNLR